LVAQLQIHERLVVTLALLQRVRLVQLLQVQLVQLVQVLLVQLVAQQAQVQLVLAQLLVVATLELVEHPCLQKKIEAQEKLVQKMLKQQENLAYLF
jgi:hypothetical protein